MLKCQVRWFFFFFQVRNDVSFLLERRNVSFIRQIPHGQPFVLISLAYILYFVYEEFLREKSINSLIQILFTRGSRLKPTSILTVRTVLGWSMIYYYLAFSLLKGVLLKNDLGSIVIWWEYQLSESFFDWCWLIFSPFFVLGRCFWSIGPIHISCLYTYI